MSGFKSRMQSCGEMMVYLLGGVGSSKCKKYMTNMVKRVDYLYDDTLIRAGDEKVVILILNSI